ncbi:MAG TPA: flagellar biosynthetic protein FliR [Gammaproteobacteria bacterium]
MALLAIDYGELMRLVGSVLWPFVRAGALLVAAPLYGARTVPVRVRLAFALVLAFLVAPSVTVPADAEPFALSGAWVTAREALIGAALGFLVQMLFAALAMGGEIVALAMGLAFASVADPDHGASVPLVGEYFVVIATLLFLAFDGHLALVALLFDSFTLLPPATTPFGAGGLWQVAAFGSAMFEAAVLVALPAAAALLLTGLCMGVVARSAPQLNVFAVGFPVTLLLGLLLLGVGVPALAPQLETALADVLDQARSALVAAR